MSGKAVFTVGAVLRGDDAAGPMLAKMMETDPIDGWTVINGEQMPEDMLGVVRRMRPDVLLLVDAASMGEAPGTIKPLREEDVYTDYLMTTHSLPLTFLLEELRDCCGKVVFLGIQPAQTEFMSPLTPAVLQAVESIYQWLKRGSAFELDDVALPDSWSSVGLDDGNDVCRRPDGDVGDEGDTRRRPDGDANGEDLS